MYQAAGFSLVKEEPHHSFGQDLIGRYWELALPTASAGQELLCRSLLVIERISAEERLRFLAA
jgi:hypothetical protein